jgi:hypothetical protein
MATSALMAIRINDSLGLRRKLTRVMYCSVVAGKKHFMFFSRQKSPRCLLGGGGGVKNLSCDFLHAILGVPGELWLTT